MKRILVIEDTFEVRDNLCEILELAGYEVQGAPEGKEGVAVAKKWLPDLILCDVMMPNLDGFGVLKILGNNPQTANIPFIFLTAKAEKKDFRKGMGLGADDYLTKPFDDTQLLEAIETRLKKNEGKKISLNPSAHQSFFSDTRALEAMADLISGREARLFDEKAAIYQEQHLPRWLYYIEYGIVKTVQTHSFGKELTTRIYNQGDFFGTLPLFQNSYKDSAIALEASSIKLIPKDDFKALILQDGNFTTKFMKMLADEVSASEEKLMDMAYSSVRRKVAMALLAFAKKEEISAPFYIKREELAAYAGTAKETVTRTLSDFKEEGKILIQNHEITILQAEGLLGLEY